MMKPVPFNEHSFQKLPASQLKQLFQTQSQPLHHLNVHSDPPRNERATIFHNSDHTNIITSNPDITSQKCKENLEQLTLPSPHNTSDPKK